VTEQRRLVWTVHLARRRPRRTAASLLVIAAGSIAAGYGFQSPLLGLLAAFLLLASISDYLLPIRFALSPEGAEARGLLHRRRMPWDRVRRVLRDDRGVKLSPLPRHSRLEPYRGIYLWFADNAGDVMAIIAHHTGTEAAGGDDTASA
jgi:hypothetical protein